MKEDLIPLSRPSIGERERRRVDEVLRSGRLALGPCLSEFEERIANLVGARHAVGVSSGTAALHLILEGLGIGPGDEVITTPFSFVASANAILYVGATPIFVDIDPITYNIDAGAIQDHITDRTRAILAVDIFGLPAPCPDHTELAQRHDLALIDDGCEAIGARISGRAIGSWADATAFGFYPNKSVTTGEGGCITTDSAEVAESCRSMMNQGRSSLDRMHHVRLGYNYRLDEMSAALGCAQLERIEELLERRRRIAGQYDQLLAPLNDSIRRPPVMADAERAWFVYVVELGAEYDAADREVLRTELAARSIESAPYFPTIHLQPYYAERFGFERGDFPKAEYVSDRTLAIPFFPGLKEFEIQRVANTLRHIVRQLGRRSPHAV